MRVVFLDFDGVLNCRTTFDRRRLFGWDEALEPACVRRVRGICDRTAAKVVVSSTWRLNRSLSELRRILENAGLTPSLVIDKTPRLLHPLVTSNVARGHEIAAWLCDHPDVTGFVILDDDDDMAHLRHRLVQTDWQRGLQDHHVLQAVRQLYTTVSDDERYVPALWAEQRRREA